MALTEKLQFLITANADNAIKAFQATGKAADKDLGNAEKKLDKVGGTLTKVGAGAVAFAGVAGAALWKVGSAAGDQNAAISAMEQVLGDASDAVLKWSDDSVKAVGLSKTAAVEAATQFGGIAKAAEMTGPQVANFAIEMTGLASDMAAFKNVKPEEALQDLQSGFAGSTEVLRKYNIYLDDSSLKAAYFRETGEKVSGTLTAQQRIIATHSEIMRQSADIQGQWNRELDSNESKTAMFKANLDNLAASIGQGVVPVMSTVLGVLNNVVTAFESLPDPVKKAVGGFAAVGTGVAALGGGLSLAVGQIIKMRENLGKIPAAVTGVTAVLAVGALAYTTYANDKAKAEQKTREFTEALKQEGEAQQEALDAIFVGQFAQEKYAAALSRTGLTIDDVAKAVKGEASPAFDELAKMYEKSGWNTLVLNELLDDAGYDVAAEDVILLASAVDVMTGRFKAGSEQAAREKQAQDDLRGSTGHLAQQYKEMEDGVRAANQAQQEGTETTEAATPVLDAYRASQERAARVAEDLAAKAKAVEDAERSLSDARRSAADATFALQDAQDDFIDTVQELDQRVQEAEGDQEALNRVYRDAARDGIAVADAQVRIAEEQAKTLGVTLSAKDATAIFTQSALEQAATLNGPARQALIDHITQVNGIPDDKATEIKAILDEYGLEAAKEAIRLATLPREVDVRLKVSNTGAVSAILGGGRVANAAGGPVAPGQFSSIADAGRPEAFKGPDGRQWIYAPDGGQVLANPDVPGVGGNTYNLFPNATINQMVDVDAAVQRINLLLAS